MPTRTLPSTEVLRQLLRYNPETGDLYWRERTPDIFEDGKHTSEHICKMWNTRYAGKVALCFLDNAGYKRGSILGITMLAHVAAYAIHHGEYPNNVDHINGVRTDNRISNLRSVTKRENSLNRAIQSNNTSGCVGVIFVKHLSKWQARIKVHGKYISLGCFADINDAIFARKEAEAKYGFHQNHGRSV